tara:strand:+ start:190 stop:1053 length:864 start_codon:yes stop_codon:yes gene_type:complete
MINVWVTGSEGQLGGELKKIDYKKAGFFFFTKKREVDITNKSQIKKYIQLNKIGLIINCAAYTNVEEAEKNTLLAYKVNSDAVLNLVDACHQFNCKLIHVSTDFIYGDVYSTPINEKVKANPKSIYAKSKFEGEQFIFNSSIEAVVIRTSWLYSKFGHNFVKTILKVSKEKDSISVVKDQYGTPTYAKNLAEICIELVRTNKKNIIGQEIYNFSNEGSCSWFEFASKIVEYANLECLILPITTKEFPTLVERSKYSVLDKTKIKNKLNLNIPLWEESLLKCIKTIIK